MACTALLGTLKRTRGAVLARLGRHAEALAMLAEADNSNDMNRCLNVHFEGLRIATRAGKIRRPRRSRLLPQSRNRRTGQAQSVAEL